MDREFGGSRWPMPSPAMVVALVALFVALGGSAWAVSKVGTSQLKSNAVTTPKIKPGAVNGSRLANGAVTGPKIGPGAVGPTNLAPGAVETDALADFVVTGPKLGTGAVGSENIADGSVTASKLATGAVGGSNISIEAINGTPVTILAGNTATATATCPGNKTAVSAGYQASSALVTVYQQYVSGNTAFIFALAAPGGGGIVQVTAKAVCI